MNAFITESVYFGLGISLLGFWVGLVLKKKFKHSLLNPLLIAILFVIIVLKILNVDYETYNSTAKYLSFLLTPATVCLAIPLYQQMERLKENLSAVLCGVLAGVCSSLGSILALAYLFGLSHAEYVTLLPKSITTAIGLGVSEELGGITTITVAAITITGLLGNIIGEQVCKLFRIKEPVAVGLSLGTASHAIGTAKALELGEIQGAMSSLSIAVAGLMTVVGASVFAMFY